MKWFSKLNRLGFLIGLIILALFLLYCAEGLVSEWTKPMQPFLHDVGQPLQGIFVCVVVGVVAHMWDKAQRTLTRRCSHRNGSNSISKT